MAVFVVIGSIVFVLDNKQKTEADIQANRAHQQLVDAHKRAAWKLHLQRLAYDKAHPQEAIERKNKARAEAVRREQQKIAASQEAARIALAEAHYANVERARVERESHPCSTASSIERETAAMDAGQAMYDSAMSGMHYAELCDDENERSIDEGYLLSFKALSEHALGTGDAQTDMNQAVTLLAQCQTLPGYYGTHAGAVCESQEESDIKTKISWEE